MKSIEIGNLNEEIENFKKTIADLEREGEILDAKKTTLEKNADFIKKQY
jgi:hypothetical protein